MIDFNFDAFIMVCFIFLISGIIIYVFEDKMAEIITTIACLLVFFAAYISLAVNDFKFFI